MMKMKPPSETRDAYYAEAATWSSDRQAALRGSRRVAWIVASTAIFIAVLEAVALILLTPLKTVVPYTLLVDRTTGYVQMLKPLDAATIAPTAALTQSLLVQYVIGRESYDVATVQADYRKVALWSAGSARASYLASMSANNADSPLARYGRSSVVETRVRSVSPLADGASLVRFETRRRDTSGAASSWQPFVALIRYRFSGEPLSVEDRYVNPLGFAVLRYRRDQEAVVPTEPDQTPNYPGRYPGTLSRAPDASSAIAVPPQRRAGVPTRSPSVPETEF